MKIFIGIFLATTVNFVMGLLGLYLVASTFVISLAPNDVSSLNLTAFDYVFSFTLKFFVILILTWILNRVMPLLDKPRKRVLFIFFLGSIFALYNEVDLFWSDVGYLWSTLVIVAESFNWLITAYILSKFIKPRHLGAL
ncbi:MAG TPA: hypothetical protein QGF66_05450 [SAR86 cluster bacterium]|jgi:hypothetical protein|nr:hypothetical protein [SAR86 cluster bacterium]HJM15812.1 hypothetical protein [SAR86 cluster bacterium]|tara:strand:+ start:824 stop:1240 length:417 start_codon:yes stop_codon:yes gene_type:complete